MTQPLVKESDRLSVIEELVSEMIKDNPNKQIVKHNMQKLGLEFSDDNVICMNRVLVLMHGAVEEPKFEC